MKKYLLERGEFLVNNGEWTRFWEDWWTGRELLMKQFPTLHQTSRRKNQTVPSALGTRPLNISFRRALVGDCWSYQCRVGSSHGRWVVGV